MPVSSSSDPAEPEEPHGDSQQIDGENVVSPDTPVPESVEPAAPTETAEPRRQHWHISTDPTPAARESHECSGHAVFEPWCVHCVRGRAQEWAHYTADRTMDDVPTILWDYGYLSSEAEGMCSPEQEAAEEAKGSSPLLVAWDSSVKRYWAHIIPAKGVDFEGFESVLQMLVGEMQ